MAEPVELPFWMLSGLGPRNRIIDGCAYWRHVANAVKQLCAALWVGTRGGDATCLQITLGNLVTFWLRFLLRKTALERSAPVQCRSFTTSERSSLRS